MKITYNFMKPILRITLLHTPFAITLCALLCFTLRLPLRPLQTNKSHLIRKSQIKGFQSAILGRSICKALGVLAKDSKDQFVGSSLQKYLLILKPHSFVPDLLRIESILFFFSKGLILYNKGICQSESEVCCSMARGIH